MRVIGTHKDLVPLTRGRWPEIHVIDDIAEGIAKTLFRGVWRFIFQLLFEFMLFYTGEIFLFISTFGKRKPRWDYYVDESASKWVIFTEISTWIGFAFWLLVAWFINNVILH